jgi:hypothetical protein
VDWLLVEILTGLQKLSLLRLANSPATEDELEGCARAWIEALAASRQWSQDDDRDDVRSAFRTLLARTPADGRAVFWPAPGDLLAAMPPKLSAPYHQPLPSAPRYALEWNKNTGNRSLTAKSHATYNAQRLGLDVPEWAMPIDDAESEAILRMIEDIHAEQIELRRQHGIPERAKAAPVGGHSEPPRAREALPDVPGPDSGPVVEGRDAIGEAMDTDDYGEALSRRVSRVDPGVCESWGVYREAS